MKGYRHSMGTITGVVQVQANYIPCIVYIYMAWVPVVCRNCRFKKCNLIYTDTKCIVT